VLSVAIGVSVASGARKALPAIVPTTGSSALGYGTFGPGTRNQFFVNATTAINGSGASGQFELFDPTRQVFSQESVTCLFVDPSTGAATIWGNVSNPSTNAFPPGPNGSVMLKLTPGSGTAASINVRTFYGAAPTTCNGSTIGTSPLSAGTVTTTGPQSQI
jgi:hypothetical protein